jgi:hypothetical protein
MQIRDKYYKKPFTVSFDESTEADIGCFFVTDIKTDIFNKYKTIYLVIDYTKSYTEQKFLANKVLYKHCNKPILVVDPIHHYKASLSRKIDYPESANIEDTMTDFITNNTEFEIGL